MKVNVNRIKDSIDRMPSLSPVIHKINEVANNVRSSAQELTDVIQLDPVLTGKVIRMVNSAYFGLSHEVKSLKQAVVILGINTIKNVALSSAFLGQMKLQAKTILNAQGFWKHSVAVGVAAKLLARQIKVDESLLEEFFIAGLIHDIGKVLINESFPAEMDMILKEAAKRNNIITNIERGILGLTHEEIGIAIGKKWKFSNQLLYSVGKHHQPVLNGDSAVYSMIVALADTYVKKLEIGFSGNYVPDPLPEELWDSLGLTEEGVLETLSTIQTEIDKAVSFLE